MRAHGDQKPLTGTLGAVTPAECAAFGHPGCPMCRGNAKVAASSWYYLLL